MVKMLKTIFNDIFTATMRVIVIFLILSIGFDAMTRIYYSYMPVEEWMDFKSVLVEERNDEAIAIIKRRPHQKTIAVFHRTLLIRYPDERRGCTNSTVTIIDDPAIDTIIVPIWRMLDDSCPAVMGGKPIEGVLQVSYIFEFPYGVKRTATRYSNPFWLSYDRGRYIVQPYLPVPGN